MAYDVARLKRLILTALIDKGKYGGAHTPLDNITHNLPDEFLHNKKGQKAIHEAVKELNNSGWIIILTKRTGKGSDLHISINPKAIKELSANFPEISQQCM
ncbi:hypothetical protein HY490_00005 [Candidatus Woesearchaeota archaeon]|nr:hypothetical protein [Candidatus Woesearchaeota archaeon]